MDAAPATATAPLRPPTLNALDAEASVTPCSAAAPPSETNGVCRAPGSVSGAWISSDTTRTPYCSASDAIRPRSAALNTRPVGLCGLQSRYPGERLADPGRGGVAAVAQLDGRTQRR